MSLLIELVQSNRPKKKVGRPKRSDVGFTHMRINQDLRDMLDFEKSPNETYCDVALRLIRDSRKRVNALDNELREISLTKWIT